MNREVHVRIWERPEVRVLRATRRHLSFEIPAGSAQLDGKRSFAYPISER